MLTEVAGGRFARLPFSLAFRDGSPIAAAIDEVVAARYDGAHGLGLGLVRGDPLRPA
jgi:hypothetical protein